jgi:peptidyl-prolyl cis-trans isomerase C
MTRRSKLFLPTLALALLATGLVGCNRNEEEAATPAGDQAQTGTPAPGTPAAPGTATPGTQAPGTAPGQQPQAAPPMDPNQLPAVVAKVNGKEIKKEDLVERAQGMRAQLAQARGVQVPLNEAFYREILDGIIAHHLLLQEATQKGISITDAEVEQQLAQLKKQFPSQEVYQKQLAANKMTEADLKKQMRGDDNKVNKLIETTIVPTVQVSEADARAFYDQNQERMKTPPRAHVRHILIAVPPQAPAADREAARKKADGILQQLKDGGDFAQLAAQNSNDPGSAARGGDLSWITPGQMVPAFEKAAFALKQPSEISPVVETRFGYHIIQLAEREEGQTVPFEQAKNRIGAMLQERKAQEAVRAHVQELKSKAKVETFI